MLSQEQHPYHCPQYHDQHNHWDSHQPLQLQQRRLPPHLRPKTRWQPHPKRLPQLPEWTRSQQKTSHLQNQSRSPRWNPRQRQTQKQRRRKLGAFCTARSAKLQSTQHHSWRLIIAVRSMCPHLL